MQCGIHLTVLHPLCCLLTSPLCWLLRTPVQEIGMLRTIEQASLPKQVRCEYNQWAHTARTRLSTRLSLRRRGSIHAVTVHLNQATSLFPFSPAPRMSFALDQPINDLACARYTRRPNQREIRPACGKRAVATTADHSSSTGQTPLHPEDRPVSPGYSGQNGSNVETSDLPCPARNTSAASIVNSSVGSGSANHRRAQASQGSRSRQSR